jgi:glutaredoxin 3
MITVYSKKMCPYCDKAKQLLEMWGMEYTEVKIDEDPAAREFCLEKGHRSVPQIYINETCLEGGYDGLSAAGKEKVTTLLEG